ncbi:MAG: outer membrane protein assembly factor BamB [bacterium]
MKKLLIVLSLTLLVVACGGKEKETEWGIFNEPVESVELPAAAGAKELNVAWEQDVGESGNDGYAILRPAVNATGVYATNRRGHTKRFDPETGKLVWETRLGKNTFAGVGLGEGLVLVALDSGKIIAMSAESGEEKWQVAINRQISAVPVAGAGRVIVRTADGLLIGLDSANGDTVWSVQRSVPGLSVHGDSVPLIAGDSIITGLANGKLMANSVVNGRDFWETDLSFVRGTNELERLSDIDSPPVVLGATLYAATYQGDLVSVDLQSSGVQWRKGISTRLPISVLEDNLFVTSELGEVSALSTDTGEVLWSQPSFKGRGISNPLGMGSRVVIGDASGNVHLLDSEDGSLLETRKVSKGAITSLTRWGAGFIAFSVRGAVSAVTLAGN